MISIPLPVVIERDDEQIRSLQLYQNCLTFSRPSSGERDMKFCFQAQCAFLVIEFLTFARKSPPEQSANCNRDHT